MKVGIDEVRLNSSLHRGNKAGVAFKPGSHATMIYVHWRYAHPPHVPVPSEEVSLQATHDRGRKTLLLGGREGGGQDTPLSAHPAVHHPGRKQRPRAWLSSNSQRPHASRSACCCHTWPDCPLTASDRFRPAQPAVTTHSLPKLPTSSLTAVRLSLTWRSLRVGFLMPRLAGRVMLSAVRGPVRTTAHSTAVMVIICWYYWSVWENRGGKSLEGFHKPSHLPHLTRQHLPRQKSRATASNP